MLEVEAAGLKNCLHVFPMTLSISPFLSCVVFSPCAIQTVPAQFSSRLIIKPVFLSKWVLFLMFSPSWWKWTSWTACCWDCKNMNRLFVFFIASDLWFDCHIFHATKAAEALKYNVPHISISLLSGRQPKAIQGGGKRPSGWSDCRRCGLEQTQAVEWVHHCGAVSGPVQIHRAVSNLPPQVPDFRDLYVLVAASGFHQQVFPSGQASKTCSSKLWRDILVSHNFRFMWFLKKKKSDHPKNLIVMEIIDNFTTFHAQ